VKIPVHESEVPSEVFYRGTDREINGKALCDQGGRAKVGVGLMELPPGSHTKPAHWHSKEEEHVYVMSGRLTLHLGSQSYELTPGSFVCFPAGQRTPHYLHNTGAEPCRYLIVGERIEDDEVTYSRDRD